MSEDKRKKIEEFLEKTMPSESLFGTVKENFKVKKLADEMFDN